MPAADALQFRTQVRDATASGPRNLAEGSGAFNRREFARFTRIARRSPMETKNHLLDGGQKGYFSPASSAGC